MLLERGSARVLALGWFLLLVYGEFGAFYFMPWSCTWPERVNRAKVDVVVEHDAFDAEVAEAWQNAPLFRMAIIADPQLTDFYSYSQKQGTLLRLTEFYSDIYMRRAFQYSVMRKPYADEVMVLGDLFDGGRVASKGQYVRHMRRFLDIFGAAAHASKSPLRFAAGNHDIGLGGFYSPDAAERFAQHFGPRNYTFNVHTSEFVVLDSVALTHESYATSATAARSKEAQRSKAFIDGLKRELPWPRVIFTHIPLWRPERAECNASLWRGKASVRQGYGVSYQNQLTKKATVDVLGLYPQLVFSGDDHDRCLYYHVHKGPTDLVYGTNILKTPEVTLPTFSWLQGTSYPGYGLLTVETKGRFTTLRVRVCQLPNQRQIYASYVAMLLLTIGVLAIERKYIILFNYSRASHAAILKKSENASRDSVVRLIKREGPLNSCPQFLEIVGFVLVVYCTLLVVS